MLPAMRACPRCLAVFASDPEFCSLDGERLAPSGTDPLIGRTLAGCRLEARLGVGSSGCVYRGRHLASGEPCAVKLLYGELAGDRSVAQRFRREAEVVAQIRHPNVVSIIEHGTTAAGLTFLVMEYLEGRTLKEVIEAEAPLEQRRSALILEQLTAGLAEAHRLGYVHRDLKPGNVIVVGPPGEERAKILDFGIVASLRDTNTEDRLTRTGFIVGTPIYMAPEQIDPNALSPQVDVYALGVILYEMLAGAPPFRGTVEQILVAKMTARPAPLPSAGPLGALALELLESNPKKRPQSALYVRALLGRMALLSPDPATVKARVPALPEISDGGYFLPTVRVVDPDVEEQGGDAEPRTGSITRQLPPVRPGSWTGPQEVGEEAPTQAAPRPTSLPLYPDTLLDPPDPYRFDGLDLLHTPTFPSGVEMPYPTPDAGDAGDMGDTGDTGDEVAQELPTAVSPMPLEEDEIGSTSGVGSRLAATEADLLSGSWVAVAPVHEPSGETSLDLEEPTRAPPPARPRVRDEFADEVHALRALADLAGDADTALEFHVDDLRNMAASPSQTQMESPVIGQTQAGPTKLNTWAKPRTRRRGLWVGLIFTALLVVTAAVTYAVIDGRVPVRVEIPAGPR